MAPGPLRVPELTAYFWVLTGLAAGLGRTATDYLVGRLGPAEMGMGSVGIAFLAALSMQFSIRRYVAWTYWLAVAGTAVFGTMAANALHTAFVVHSLQSGAVYLALLFAIFVTWQRTEGTVSPLSIDTARREAFYWAAVSLAFAVGTGLSNMTVYDFKLGFRSSALLFAGVVAVLAAVHRLVDRNRIVSFWLLYTALCPFGASVVGWATSPRSGGGLGRDNLPVAVLFALLIGIFVSYLAVTRRDVRQPARLAPAPGDGRVWW